MKSCRLLSVQAGCAFAAERNFPPHCAHSTARRLQVGRPDCAVVTHATSRTIVYFDDVTHQSVQTCIAGEPRICVEQPGDRRLDRDGVTRCCTPSVRMSPVIGVPKRRWNSPAI